MGLSQAGWKPATKLLDWAFAHGAQATPVGQLVTPADLAATHTAATAPPAAGRQRTGRPRPHWPAVGPARWLGWADLAAAAALVAGLA